MEIKELVNLKSDVEETIYKTIKEQLSRFPPEIRVTDLIVFNSILHKQDTRKEKILIQRVEVKLDLNDSSN